MSVSYRVYLKQRALPDAGWLGSAVRAMAPKFEFAGAYDFTADTGWCPCRLDGADCGFEWELDAEPDVPADLAARRFDAAADIGFRSGDADAVCAVLVAANVAQIADGVIVTPDDERIDADAALAWASDVVRQLKKGTKKRAKPKAASPAEILERWLAALRGASVEGCVRSLPDDPLVGIRFGGGIVLKMRRWSLSDGAGECSTADFPRAPSPAQVASLDANVQRLVAMLRAGPIASATFDADTLALRLDGAGGSVTAHAQAAVYADAYAAALKSTDRWELRDAKDQVHPDADERQLVRI
ncbi:MAG TPA: hypothetical protein VJ724_08355 [Tahibacter sp.]|nr:hypothetical protein [Tahibacter sp.]